MQPASNVSFACFRGTVPQYEKLAFFIQTNRPRGSHLMVAHAKTFALFAELPLIFITWLSLGASTPPEQLL